MGEQVSHHASLSRKKGALLAGILFSSSSCIPTNIEGSSPKIPYGDIRAGNISLAANRPYITPEDTAQAIDPSCKPTVLFLGGLGQEAKNDHLSRPFLPDSIAFVESVGGKFETISPKTPDDPELGEWTEAIETRINNATQSGEKIILAGYSMGVAEEMQVLRRIKGTKNAATVVFILSFSGRDTNPNNPLKRPNLKNYPYFFRKDAANPSSEPSISNDELNEIGKEWKGRLIAAGQREDKIVPEIETQNLARLLDNAPYISLSVNNESGEKDSHLASRNSSPYVLEIVQTALTKGCAVTLTH